MTRHARQGDLTVGLGDLRVPPGEVRCRKVLGYGDLLGRALSTSTGCKHKGKYGYEAPALACSTHKLEGMHEISIAEMNPKQLKLFQLQAFLCLRQKFCLLFLRTNPQVRGLLQRTLRQQQQLTFFKNS